MPAMPAAPAALARRAPVDRCAGTKWGPTEHHVRARITGSVDQGRSMFPASYQLNQHDSQCSLSARFLEPTNRCSERDLSVGPAQARPQDWKLGFWNPAETPGGSLRTLVPSDSPGPRVCFDLGFSQARQQRSMRTRPHRVGDRAHAASASSRLGLRPCVSLRPTRSETLPV